MISRLLYRIFLFFIRNPKIIKLSALVFIGLIILTLIGGKSYQFYWDRDADRGALAMDGSDGGPIGALGEKFSTPIYLDQGWSTADSLWFYNTTQGSALLPYELFLYLEHADSDQLLRAPESMDKFRYLPQKATPFNPDGLPVGFVKDTYSNSSWYEIFATADEYVGFTCAACHTGQLNYTKAGKEVSTAIRIDGGPAMADMVGFLETLELALYAVATPGEKQNAFVSTLLEKGDDYSNAEEVIKDVKKWHGVIRGYNGINYSDVEYGHARLDAFGRIYNRVLKYVINTEQAKQAVAGAVRPDGQPILNGQQLLGLFKGIEDKAILGDQNFALILERLYSLNLSIPDQKILRDTIFNAADAPVSYPFLWDIVQSTYVQWNGLANNEGLGPLGRNVGEVIGVFGILDWEAVEFSWFKPWTWRPRSALSALLTDQQNKQNHVTFDSSVDVTNLQRLERSLKSLQSPEWPQFGGEDNNLDSSPFDEEWVINTTMAQKGKIIYNQRCVECHEVIERDNVNRLLVSKMMDIDLIGTDPKMAENSVAYKGQSGNFEHSYQAVDRVGDVVIEQEAPVIQMLTAAATGVITTPDRDKWFFRRWADWLYNLVASLLDNPIKDSVKAGNYKPDTMANPYNSLLSYKARSLNGIWATAPYLHNGSVPTLYDLLLPACDKAVGEEEETATRECRPNTFYVGAREFDPQKVGMKYEGFEEVSDLTKFDTSLEGNSNKGHEYAAGNTPMLDGETKLPPLSEQERWQLIEYLKTL